MSSALFGILQLDHGEPLGYTHIGGLVQSWLQDAGGFAMVGLVVYLLYALATPTDKSQSEKIRVPVTQWMVLCASLALVFYAVVGAMFLLQGTDRAMLLGMPISTPSPPTTPLGQPLFVPQPEFHLELLPIFQMIAGLFAILGIGEPFARDIAKIARRNLSLRFAGVQRFGRSAYTYISELVTPRRLAIAGIIVALYLAFGGVVYAFGTPRLFGIYAGVCIVIATVFVLGLLSLMFFQAEGPVWAIAKLSFKEAVRSQILWVFPLILLPFLFPAQWFRQIKPVDELRVVVERMELMISLLALVPAVLLASFYGIPNDIKNLNIYTVVSKPVERFEIVLGRFFGYVAFMSLVLIGLTGVSLVLIMNTSISQKAKDETYKARVPVRGKMEFKSLQKEYRVQSGKVEFDGTNVGREFDYRKYIVGHPDSPQRAVWHFAAIPSDLAAAADDRVPVEFTFDIYKMTKGEQNKGVEVSFRFCTHQARQKQPIGATDWPWVDATREAEYKKAVADRGLKPADAIPKTTEWAEVNKLAEEFGFFETKHTNVLDYAVTGIEVPTGVFRAALKGTPGKDETGRPIPRLSVYVKCATPGQMLGMAEPDLYLLEYEQPFALNYVKSMVGLWCWLCILVGLAVTFSTYFTSVLSLLIASTLFLVGCFSDFVRDAGANRTIGGGPFESMGHLLKAEQPTAPVAETAMARTSQMGDQVWAWLVRRIQNLIPDINSYDWSAFVSEGFNINTEYLVVNLIVMFGFLLPWAIFARYMMRFREVAA